MWHRTSTTVLATTGGMVFLGLLGAALGQARPEFEVAVIRSEGPPPYHAVGLQWLSCNGSDGITSHVFPAVNPAVAPRGRCAGRLVELRTLISFAFDARVSATSIGRNLFRIDAKSDDSSNAGIADLKQMLQSLLVDRFKLKFRRITRDVNGLALVVSKADLKLKPASGQEEPPYEVYESNRRHVIKGKSSLRKLADFLSPITSENCPLVDKTGLSGIYEYSLTLNLVRVHPDETPPAGGKKGEGGGPGGCQFETGVTRRFGSERLRYYPPVSIAIRQQLGLKVEPQRVPIETIVVDEAEAPSEN